MGKLRPKEKLCPRSYSKSVVELNMLYLQAPHSFSLFSSFFFGGFCGRCCGASPTSAFRTEAITPSAAGSVNRGHSQRRPSLGISLGQKWATCFSQGYTPCPGATCIHWLVDVSVQRPSSLVQCETLLKGPPSSSAPHGIGWAFIASASWFHFSFCPALLPLLTAVAPENSPK